MHEDIPAWADWIMVSALLTLIGIVWRNLNKRVDTLEQAKADHENLETLEKRVDRMEDGKADKSALATLDQQMRDHRTETRESFTRVFDRLDVIVDRLTK